MLARTSLTTRAFLFSFLPVCVVLAASFLALNTLVQQHVKDGLRDSLQKSEELLDRANADYSRRISQFVTVLADSAGLKAAIGLTHETAHQRVAHTLANLASTIGRRADRGIEVDVRNEELANEANVTPFTASRLLSAWQRKGILTKSRGKILLRSPELLFREV